MSDIRRITLHFNEMFAGNEWEKFQEKIESVPGVSHVSFIESDGTDSTVNLYFERGKVTRSQIEQAAFDCQLRLMKIDGMD